eukprot:15436578-Alexandrium_andersonii.AAC.1
MATVHNPLAAVYDRASNIDNWQQELTARAEERFAPVMQNLGHFLQTDDTTAFWATRSAQFEGAMLD